MSFTLPGTADRVSEDAATAVLFDRTFESTNVPTEAFVQSNTGMTVAASGGFMVVNSGNDTTVVDLCQISTRRTFPLIGEATTGEFWIQTTGDTEDSAALWGFFTANGTASPADGIYFRLAAGASLTGGIPDATPVLQGVLNVNGTETVVNLKKGSATLPASGAVHRYRIETRADNIIFAIDGTPAGSIAVPSTTPMGTLAPTQPVAFGVFNGAPAAARTIKVGRVAVYRRHHHLHMAWGHQMSGAGLGAYQNPPASATGQTANWANSAAPASATLSNTAAGYTTLGGQYQFAASATNETDWALFVYTNPAHAAAAAGRTLKITSIRIGEMVVTGAAVAQTTMFWWFVGVGSSAASLATGDTTTTTSYRRVALGAQTFVGTPAIGTIAPGFTIDFSVTPLVAPAGTRVCIGLKQLNGTNTGSLVWRGTVTVNGYFE